jgi:hypothetical protein
VATFGRAEPVDGTVHDVSASEAGEGPCNGQSSASRLLCRASYDGGHLKIKVTEAGNRFTSDQSVSRSSAGSLN